MNREWDAHHGSKLISKAMRKTTSTISAPNGARGSDTSAKATANGDLPGPCSSFALTPYQRTIRALSDRLVEAQRPVRILEAIRWDDAIEKAFFAAGCREMPAVTREYYERRLLPFDPADKLLELSTLERDIRRQLGVLNAPGQIMTRMCQEYRDVVQMLLARGTRGFVEISERLYGSASDCFHAGDPTLAEFGQMMAGALDNLAQETLLAPEEETIDAPQAVEQLSARLGDYFGDRALVRVQLSDGLTADAAAGCDYLKIRGDARFTPREVRLLEVHEGWVHLGTTLNGQAQPICTFLSKGPPSSTTTQEGLAVLTEVLSFASHPGRLRRLTNRIEAVAMAEAGANFLEVYRFFLEEGYDPHESYQQALRVFRGSLPDGCGPFTKDLSYGKGFVLVYNFLRLAVTRGLVRRVPLLFCGKTALTDAKLLGQLVEEGLVILPRFVPPPFRDLHGLSAWMCYAGFLNRLSLQRMAEDYADLL
jgi:uncharacterized protein (TIGR02421 family)